MRNNLSWFKLWHGKISIERDYFASLYELPALNYHKGLLNFSVKDVNILLKLTLNLSSVLVFESIEWYKKEGKMSKVPGLTLNTTWSSFNSRENVSWKLINFNFYIMSQYSFSLIQSFVINIIAWKRLLIKWKRAK